MLVGADNTIIGNFLLNISSFLEIIDSSMARILKVFSKKYDWDRGTGEILISDLSVTFSEGNRVWEMVILYRKSTKKDDWIRILALKEDERYRFVKRIRELEDISWRDYYDR